MKEQRQSQVIDFILSDSHLGPQSFKEVTPDEISAFRRKGHPYKEKPPCPIPDITLFFGEKERGYKPYWFLYKQNGTVAVILVKYQLAYDNVNDLPFLDSKIKWKRTPGLIYERVKAMIEFKVNLIKMLQTRQITS